MTDKTVVHIGENSPEQVAYKLMLEIARAEDIAAHSRGEKRMDREWILSTYHQCLRVVRGIAPTKS